MTMVAPLALTCAGHLLWPFMLDPYLLTFTVSYVISVRLHSHLLTPQY